MEPKVTGTTPEEREYFTRVMDEAREQREHAERLAKIESDKQVSLVQARLGAKPNWEEREWKRHFVVGVLVGLFLLATIAACWIGIVRVHDSDRLKFQQQEQLQQETAQKCIEAGNIWLNGDCLLANKGATK